MLCQRANRRSVIAGNDNASTFESARCDWQPGDEFIGHGNTRWRILAIVPHELIAEFHDSAEFGLSQVEPLDWARAQLVSVVERWAASEAV